MPSSQRSGRDERRGGEYDRGRCPGKVYQGQSDKNEAIWIRSILSVLLLSVSQAYDGEREPDERNTTGNGVRKNIGSLLALYPKPMTVVGARSRRKSELARSGSHGNYRPRPDTQV